MRAAASNTSIKEQQREMGLANKQQQECKGEPASAVPVPPTCDLKCFLDTWYNLVSTTLPDLYCKRH
eukprot:scaffold61462_cov22-Tisochrysis_lutea.AAC.1